jgi:hypothetical protein
VCGEGRGRAAVPVSSSSLCPSTFILAPGAARLGLRRRGSALGPAEPSRGEARGRRGQQQRRAGAEHEQQPAAEELSPPPPPRFKKIHQLHGRSPPKGARRHLVGVNSGRRMECDTAGGAPAPAARTKAAAPGRRGREARAPVGPWSPEVPVPGGEGWGGRRGAALA